VVKMKYSQVAQKFTPAGGALEGRKRNSGHSFSVPAAGSALFLTDRWR
jgi:hypothetical protein